MKTDFSFPDEPRLSPATPKRQSPSPNPLPKGEGDALASGGETRQFALNSWMLQCLVGAVFVALMGWLPVRGAEHFVKSEEDRARIEQALPQKAPAKPAKPRRLLIFTLNVGYGGHPSMAYANEAFTLMGKKTGTFETTVSDDPAVFERESLKHFDAVFFNNTVGNCFTNPALREDLVEFVVGGGGLMGVHGTTVAFTRWPGAFEDWPEFGYMIGARGANHKDSQEHLWLKLDDPDYPVTRMFDRQGFDYRDEFFRPQGTYSRNLVRVLLSIDTRRCDPNQGQPRGNCYRADNDYAVAWVRNYGRGRVFYCTIAHNPYVFWDSRMLEFYLAAAQFALGDLPAPTTPSARLTRAVMAQEGLGWRAGVATRSPQSSPVLETLEQAAKFGPAYVGLSTSQPISKENGKLCDAQLSDSELSEVRLRLEAAGLRLVTCEVGELPADEASCRRLFEFGRKMGVETLIGVPQPEDLSLIAKLCDEYEINLAVDGRDARSPGQYRSVKEALASCQGRSPRLGVCGDLLVWQEAGVDPVRAVRTLRDRLLVVRMNRPAVPGYIRATRAMLSELQHLGVKPTVFLFPYQEAGPELSRRLDSFDKVTLELLTGP